MRFIRQGAIWATAAILVASAQTTQAIEHLTVSMECSNVALARPSVPGDANNNVAVYGYKG